MNVRTLILAILHFKEASGYEIKKMSSDGAFSFFVDISFGSIYPTLARLEQEGMVACRSETHQGKPDSKIYSITAKGEAELKRGLAQGPHMDKFKSEFLLLAMNADLLDAEGVSGALAERMGQIEAKLATLDDIIARCDHPATCWVANYGRHVMRSGLSYLRQYGDELVSMTSPSSKKTRRQAAE
ncbi:MAG: PadR family transcriptional regulator [Salaquimonas sp.]|jgi:DNA-binding PadR family transcriptional regulator|nr:PadR family transcriptional regulator [Salaquimonas sp.]